DYNLSDALVKSVAMFLAGTRANPEALAIIFQTWHRRPQSSSIVLPQQHTLQQLAAQLAMYMCDLAQWGKVAEILGLMPSDTALWILSAADPQWATKILPHIKSKTVRENLGHACVAAAEKEPGAANVLPLQKIEAKSAPTAEKESADSLNISKKESGAQFRDSNGQFSAILSRSGKEKVGVGWGPRPPHAIPRGRPKNSVP
ncbi:MAG: hypothetical protein LBI69_05245, partial [Puniceicoccales bacterium]|nr:hypothetical protein [Puniceicoccales bacterium]